MKVKKTVSLLVLAAVLLLCTGCQPALPNESMGASVPSEADTVTYTVELRTEGGMPLSGIRVDVYKNQMSDDLVWAAETDEYGKITFRVKQSDTYAAVLSGVPEGYQTSETYPLGGTYTKIVMKTFLQDGSELTDVSFGLGNIIRDCTVTAVDGTVYRFSDLLAEKKAIVLNFWFLNCGPCRTEFPYLEEAYKAYSSEIAVLAINPLDETNEKISSYAQELGLTFPMAAGDAEWQSCMNLTAYPTTVIIDRYGMICLIHRGSITETQIFAGIFEYFTADDYRQTIFRNLSDME